MEVPLAADKKFSNLRSTICKMIHTLFGIVAKQIFVFFMVGGDANTNIICLIQKEYNYCHNLQDK